MESPGPKHPRNISRSSRLRSSTKGPLDDSDDPLASEALESETSESKAQSNLGDFTGESFRTLDSLAPNDLPPELARDLSYLLRYDIYHSLSQVDIPPALRSEFVGLTPDEPLSASLGNLERLLAEGHFLLAAYMCGTILSSSSISPTDNKLVFALFYTRLACLELSGHAILAAHESKALEDLTSAFYYVDINHKSSDNAREQNAPKNLRHIVPWPLRVLAVRLQSIGFGDSRRGIGGLYEIGLEAWREIMQPNISRDEKSIWKGRLADLGIRSVNALIEMGDLDAAKRSLHNMRTSGPGTDANKLRKVLLFLLIGDMDGAKQLLNEADPSEKALFKPLISMSEGNYKDAVVEWRELLENQPDRPDEAMISQNLAVCLLYTGQLNEARQLFESLISVNQSFTSLVFNMSTVYELCSDKSDKMKAGLVETVARRPISGQANLDRSNADFKL